MSKVTSKDGTPIDYETIGKGPALIIVTGASQFRAADPKLAELAKLLSDEFTVVTYDRRGRGKSGDTLPYAAGREVEDIGALIDAVGGRASLLGFSSGATLAVEAAAAGLPIDKVIAYEPPVVVEGSGRDPKRDWIQDKMEQLLKEGNRRELARVFFVDSVGLPPDEFEGMMASPFGKVLDAIAHTLTYDGRIVQDAYPHQKWPHRFKETDTPILFLNGDKTFPFIPKGVEAFAKQIPNSSRRTLPGQDHGPAPEAVAPAVREYLAA